MDNKDSDEVAASENVRVSIFDQLYSLRSPKGVEHIKQIAQIVDERMRQIATHTTTFELSRIAVLAALNIAGELQDLKALLQEEEMQANTVADSPVESESAEAPRPESAQTWFEAIFDAEVPVKERSERLSTQVSSKLQTSRQDNSRETNAPDKIDVEELEPPF